MIAPSMNSVGVISHLWGRGGGRNTSSLYKVNSKWIWTISLNVKYETLKLVQDKRTSLGPKAK